MSKTIIPIDLAYDFIMEGSRRESGLPRRQAQAIADRYGVVLGINGIAGLGPGGGIPIELGSDNPEALWKDHHWAIDIPNGRIMVVVGISDMVYARLCLDGGPNRLPWLALGHRCPDRAPL
jgi:hypothetical protein